MTPMKAIRAKCLDCCCGSSHEVRLCTVEKCPLYLYRFGKNPKRTGMGNPNALFSFRNSHSTRVLEIKTGKGYTSTTQEESGVNPPVRTRVLKETEE